MNLKPFFSEMVLCTIGFTRSYKRLKARGFGGEEGNRRSIVKMWQKCQLHCLHNFGRDVL